MLLYLLTVYSIFISSFVYTAIANPGIPEGIDPNITVEQLPANSNGITYCKICNLYMFKLKNKRNNPLHCSTCGVCIQGIIIYLIINIIYNKITIIIVHLQVNVLVKGI